MLLFLAFLTLVQGQKLIIDPLTPTVVLLSFGSAEVTISALYEGPDANATFSRNEGLPKSSLGTAVSSPSAGGFTNYSFPITFSSVGVLDYTLTVGTVSVSSNLTVAGFDIFDDDDILSGPRGKGVVVGLYGRRGYDVRTVGIDGLGLDDIEDSLSTTSISFVGDSGAPTNMRELDLSNTRITPSRFVLALNDFRIGDGNFVINFEVDDIRYKGESFKTTLKVRQESERSTPCVAVTLNYSLNDGFLSVPMFNVLLPPRERPATVVVTDSSGRSATLDRDKSSLVLPDQIAVFDVSELSGALNFTCDGSEVLLQGAAIALPGTRLASDLIQRVPGFDYMDKVQAIFYVLNLSPEPLTAEDGQAMLKKFCDIIRGYSCVIKSSSLDSAMVTLNARVVPRNCDFNELIDTAFKRCEIQNAVGYDCDKLRWDILWSAGMHVVGDDDDGDEYVGCETGWDSGTDDGSKEGTDNEAQTPARSPRKITESPAPCIGAAHLRHLAQESLVYPKHHMARVRCDMNNSCATSGHMVVFQRKAMMMKTYCDMVGCSDKVMLVNSVKSGRVESETDGLEFTKFAARHVTRIEELVMKGMVRMGV